MREREKERERVRGRERWGGDGVGRKGSDRRVNRVGERYGRGEQVGEERGGERKQKRT